MTLPEDTSAPAKPQILFSLDLEDHTGAYAPTGRYIDNTRRLMDRCEEASVRGTVFVVGRVAETAPALVRDIAARGHEIACHSWAHVALDKLTPEAFRADTVRAKQCLEDVTGHTVSGYRAPVFSVTQATLWAVPILAEAGFTYSSSIMPAPNPLYGMPGAPHHPFRWKNGLVEFPCPVHTVGSLSLPYLGGIYLRYLPMPLVRRWAEKTRGTSLWTYCHPYDFDADEPFCRIAGANLLTSALLWMNRRQTWARVRELTAGTTLTLGQIANTVQDLESWTDFPS